MADINGHDKGTLAMVVWPREDLVKAIVGLRVNGRWDRGRSELTRKQMARTSMSKGGVCGTMVEERPFVDLTLPSID